MSEAKTEHPQGCVCCEISKQVSTLVGMMAPPEARDHFRASRVEFLKGVRSMLDKRIEQLSTETQSRGASISVE